MLREETDEEEVLFHFALEGNLEEKKISFEMLPVVNEWEPREVRGQSPTLASREALESPLLSLSRRTQPACLPNLLFFPVSRKRRKSCGQPEPGFPVHGEFS